MMVNIICRGRPSRDNSGNARYIIVRPVNDSLYNLEYLIINRLNNFKCVFTMECDSLVIFILYFHFLSDNGLLILILVNYLRVLFNPVDILWVVV